MGGSALNAIGEQISAILWNVFNRPRLIDLIDILLLTIIIYELLVHVRQTRVSQTIKGIIILLIATWLSDVLGMRTIHALLAWMINAGPVLLIVLFQSEIRRILEELGNNSVFDSSTALVQAGNAELIIDEMILALEHMARRKVGALIVIENKIRLNDVIATGTRVDGVYTADPEKDPAATKFDEITFEEVLDRRLKVMDLTAFTLCRENGLQIIVFDMDTPGNLGKVLAGERIGTLVKK
mgnify:CR=1 FL=1